MSLLKATDFDAQEFISRFTASGVALLCDDTAAKLRCAFICPAQGITPEKVNRLIGLSGGILFVPISSDRASEFMLSPMSRPRMNPVQTEEDSKSFAYQSAMTESVESREGVTTGISTADRARTISVLGEPQCSPQKLVKPGHIFPLETRAGGVLLKNALPEGAVDLVRLAGFTSTAVLLDALNSEGGFISKDEAEEIVDREGIPLVTLGQLVKWRLKTEKLVYKFAEAKLPTQIAGELRSCIYKSTVFEGEHLALIKGDLSKRDPVLTRVQTEFTFSDVFGGNNPPTRSIIQRALKAIADNGSGIFLYLRRPVTGQLGRQISSWRSEYDDRSLSGMREYGLGAQILRELGVTRVELLSSGKSGSAARRSEERQADMLGLDTFGIDIVSQRPVPE